MALHLNNRVIFSGEPTLEAESTHKLLASDIKEHNVLTFISQKGSYNFFNLRIEGEYKEASDTKYYFNVDKKERKYIATFDLIDTVSDKRFNFYVNDINYDIDTSSDIVSIDVTDSIVLGRNTIIFAPSDDVAIANVKITEYD